ncbi:hypothetical protein B484DRAFT_122778 [Ochromonadaceae sp. CCMP2298]|nr:hypothetical protein B484DRAFT_122778 [Ochromonadaceae sp. CCMP2298]|mmetsp:Transcript_2187/g.5217  ORF Transcript_2187/g.5217 Transcript_2187/m.5217 type:complete len:185 (+) Transcript_2187:126-680(+)
MGGVPSIQPSARCSVAKKLVLDVVQEFGKFYTDEDPSSDDFERAKKIWSTLQEEKGDGRSKDEYVELMTPLITFYDSFMSHVAAIRPKSPLLNNTMSFKSKFVVNLMALLLMVSSATAKFPSNVESFARAYKAEGMGAEEYGAFGRALQHSLVEYSLSKLDPTMCRVRLVKRAMKINFEAMWYV